MAKRAKPRPLPPDWIAHTTTTINGREITPGTELSIRGARGRFRFIQLVERPERGVEWIDVWGGPKGAPQWRSFRPDRVRRVHRIQTTDQALMEARKAARKKAA